MSRRAAQESVLDDSGLTLEDVAASAAAVWGLVMNQDPDREGEGWMYVARAAVAMFDDGGDTDSSLSWKDFAGMLRRAYARSMYPDEEIADFDALPHNVRVAWEYAARHVANLCNMDPQEARRVEQHEQRMAQLGQARLANPEVPR